MKSRYAVLGLALVLIVAVAVVGAGCKSGGSGATATKTPYKIGAVLSLTGTYAGLGEPEKNVIEMELKRINDAGGVNGHKVDVLIEDDGTDEAKALAAATKLIDKDKVLALLGATGTGQTMAFRKNVDTAGIPDVSLAGGTPITKPVDKLVFATPWSNGIVVPFTLKYLKSKGITKVGIIADSSGFGKDGVANLKAFMPKFGVTSVAEESFNPGDTDMTAQLTKIKNTDAQAILMWTAGKEAVIVAKNCEQLKIKIPLFGSHGNARVEFIQGAGTAAEGFRFAAGKILIPSTYGEGTEGFKVATDFVDRYTKAYGKAPDTFAGHAYDGLNIIVNAMKALPEDFTSAQLRDQIEATKGWVGIGGTFNFSAANHNGLSESDLVMYEIKGGKWVLAK